MSGSKKFSVLQIVIIAVILGVVSKTIIPHASQAAEQELKIQQLVNGLERMRTCLDLYIAQHDSDLPPTTSNKMFARALTKKLDLYGPYIDRIPTNPFNGLSTVRFDGIPAGADLAGWRLDTYTGFIQADSSPEHAEY